jgi:hypothetical protein
MLETKNSSADRFNSKGPRETVFRGPLPCQQRLLWRGGHAGLVKRKRYRYFVRTSSNRTLLSNWFVVSLPECGSYWLWPGLRR